jgi:putative nucleotidyltransferase with HDIG domain
MLSVISAAVAVGSAVAAVIRLWLGLDLQVPLTLAKVLLPLLAVPWAWHWRKWPGVAWAEAIAYVVMVAAAQTVMEVNVLSAFLLIPVLGVIHRDRWLTLVSAALGTVATGFLLMWPAVTILDNGRPALQFGAQLVLQWTLALIYAGLIGLAEKAERYLRHARMTGQMATQWAASIEARDRYTGGHVDRVTRYAMKLAPHIPELDMDLDSFGLACILHDVGKIAVPDSILNKPGPLTPEEHEIMKSHATKGYDLVLRTDVPMEVAVVVRHHHERWDGQGYPDCLRGEAIPVAARILAVADAFDAMTTDRPYRAGLSLAEARARIQAGSGSQFDPAVVAVFMRQFAEGWVEPGAPAVAAGWGVPGEVP